MMITTVHNTYQTSTKGKSITESDLVPSQGQVTEHCCVELKVQDISEETKAWFKKT